MFKIFLSDVAYAAGGPGQPSTLEMLALPAIFIAIMYFLIILPQQKKQKEHQRLLDGLKAGDEVITSGGLIGRIKSIADFFVTIDVGSNVSIKVAKSHVSSLTEKLQAKDKPTDKK